MRTKLYIEEIIMFRTRFIVLFISLFMSLAAISAPAQTLPEGKWRLVSYNFMDKVAYPIDKMEITMNIRPDGKLGGNSGCNVYGGSYSFDKGKLKIGSLISTMMACEEPSMQFEHNFSQTLQSATKFSLINGRLKIIDPKTKNFLRFERNEQPNKLPRSKNRRH